MNLLEMEMENSTNEFDQQYGMNWNLKNWPFDIIEIVSLYLREIRNKILCEYIKLMSRTT